MRSALRKQLDAELNEEFGASLPQFKPRQMPKSEPSIWVASKTPKSLTFFIMISPISKEDSFALELAWSQDGQFPWDSIGIEFNPTLKNWRGRLGQTFVPPRDSIWELDPEYKLACMKWLNAMEKGKQVPMPTPREITSIAKELPVIVGDIVASIKKHAIPVFCEVQRIRGCTEIV